VALGAGLAVAAVAVLVLGSRGEKPPP
jgi:hypothetical protein